jgi:CO/xanthine dehydrogenase FAD-binding subunit
LTEPSAATSVAKIVGELHKLLLGTDGQVVGWGAFDDGQLGAAGGSSSLDAGFNLPVPIPLPGRATDVAAGEGTSYALLADGTVVAWGRADAGQLGNELLSSRDSSKPFKNGSASPVRVAGLADVVQIAAAGGSALALHRDGSVSAWGSRGAGVVGDGLHPKRHGESGPPATTPVRVPGVSGVVQLSTSGAHALALTGDGRVLSWGSNHYGALGRPPRQELPMDQAAEVPGLADVIAVAAGLGVSTALKKDGTVCHVIAGGKKCVAAASNDTATMLLCLDAEVVLQTPAGARTLPLEEFYVADGIKNTVLEAADLLVQIRVPKKTAALRLEGYAKLRHRNAIDYPLLSVGVRIDLDDKGVIVALRCVVSALQARPHKLATAPWVGRVFDQSVVDELKKLAFAKCVPVKNIADDAAWRRDMVPVLVQRAVDEAVAGRPT